MNDAAKTPNTDHATPSQQPNIIHIMLDDWGYYELSHLGHPLIETPSIDRMATEGMMFTRMLAGGAVCAPTRCVLLTGQHTGHTSVRENKGPQSLLPGEPTIASMLKDRGYATGGFGKWGVGERGTNGVPEQHGFDVFYGYYHQVHAHSYYPIYLLRNSEKIYLEGNTGDFYTGRVFSHELIYQESVKFIRENKDKPFFAYLAWTPPHGQWGMPEDDPAWQKYKDRQWDAGYSRREQDARMYAAMINMADRQIGEIFSLLRELGIDEKTIVFLSGDNGGGYYFSNDKHPHGFFDPNKDPKTGVRFRGRKGNFYEGGLRVPMIARWSGNIDAGTATDHLCYFADVMPTIAELTGAELPENRDGISITPTLLGKENIGREQGQHTYLYWETRNRESVAVRTDRWKAIRPKGAEDFELYDLSADIEEKYNVASRNKQILEQMKTYAEEAHTPQREGWYLDESLGFKGAHVR